MNTMRFDSSRDMILVGQMLELCRDIFLGGSSQLFEVQLNTKLHTKYLTEPRLFKIAFSSPSCSMQGDRSAKGREKATRSSHTTHPI